MKLKVARMSGRPVDLKDIEAFDTKWKAGYDVIVEENAGDMKKIHDELEKLDAQLKSEFPSDAEWDFINTSEEWLEKVNEYGPIMIGRVQDTQDLAYLIIDQPL